MTPSKFSIERVRSETASAETLRVLLINLTTSALRNFLVRIESDLLFPVSNEVILLMSTLLLYTIEHLLLLFLLVVGGQVLTD